ncbi:type II secretion system secretin GspD [Geomonas sp. Red32]|uniref:type II secretion system secretin GspD n=1 Tax=Geomonas sp. Red32 TaxID=2912856 RepID=UPI00202CD9C9|nr:type II secretion system secretin GspD [Geomonas sp. Red32]MCM0080131.1 type II secretion system secretin GspD [Geomonas sp. Red32]
MLMFLLAAPNLALAKGVVLNFTDVDIATMVKFISDLTGKNFVMDDRVKGKISIFSPTKLSNEDAYNVFTSVLELKGFTVVPAGKVMKIVPTAAAKQSGMRVLVDGERSVVNDTYQARVLPLQHIAPQDAVSVLQPLISRDGQITAFGSNMLLLIDSALNAQKIMGILKYVDTDQVREKPELVFLKNASVDSVLNVVKDWLGGRSGKQAAAAGAGGAPAASSGTTSVVADTRLNALIVFGSEKDKRDVRNLVSLVDVVPPTTSSKVNVYYLENAEAAEVAKVLEGVVKGTAATAAPATPGAAAAPQAAVFDKLSITPDKATNSLVVVASPTDYQNLVQVIQKLDRRSRQVFVQAMIAEVSINKAKALGVQWGFLGAASNGSVSTAASFDPFNTFAGLGSTLAALTTAGVSVSNLNLLGSAANFPVVLQALQTNGALNVLSTPNVMTSDNKEAEIFVGENVPFLSGTNLTSTGLSQQSIERKDTGIILKIKPQISEGEYIKLDIYQEISAVKDFGTATNPNLGSTKRSAKTSVVVKNTDTVVIGGLIQDRDQVTESKIPLLGDIPGLGWLFKTKNTTREKTNLLIMLTPRIIKDARDMADASTSQKNSFADAAKSEKQLNVPEAIKATPAVALPAPAPPAP